MGREGDAERGRHGEEGRGKGESGDTGRGRHGDAERGRRVRGTRLSLARSLSIIQSSDDSITQSLLLDKPKRKVLSCGKSFVASHV